MEETFPVQALQGLYDEDQQPKNGGKIISTALLSSEIPKSLSRQ
jgi:hypothetical protein